MMLDSASMWTQFGLVILFISNWVFVCLWWFARREARYDALTGALSRKAGLAKLQYLRRKGAKGDNLLLMADLDALKQINGQLGHGHGDHVLQTLVAGLQSNLKTGEWVCRYGGDEFLVYWICSAAEAEFRLKSIQQRLAPHLSFSAEFINLKTDAPTEALIQKLSLCLGIQKSNLVGKKCTG